MRLANVLLICLFAVTGFFPGRAQDGKMGTRDESRQHRAELKKHEVVIGTQVWSYSRIYPLLDGLLQDVAATQVSSLTLNPNSSNGTNLDALQQAFQLQFQYSQMAGVQNAASAQVAGANANYQTQIAQQGAQLLQQFTQAMAVSTQAQSNLNALTAAGANQADISAAQQLLTNANAQVTSLGTMLGNLKNIPSATVPAPASPLASTPTLPAVSGSALPSGLTSNATAVTNGAPSFPATKQMDNQMALLWERLSRLVGVMAKPDSMEQTDDIFLVKFDTGIYPMDRKKQLLDVSYSLSCGQVIDLFPRAAALNITEDKYRDTAFGLGAVLNFFGLGGSVAYNREHLRVSQLLGQSSYITGRGIGQSEFGWLFGISLGDDSIAPGARTTFALVDIPATCADAAVLLSSEVWSKSSGLRVKELKTFSGTSWPLRNPAAPLPAKAPVNQAAYLTASLQAVAPRAKPAPPQQAAPACRDDCVKSIDFNRAEYDPAGGKAPVMMTIVLKQDMDQQQTVTVNGLFVPRVRDNFGRAVGSGGSSGVLEAQGSLATNSWIPTSRDTMLLTLDAAYFNDRFPRVLLSSPRGAPIDISRNTAAVTVSGLTLNCQNAVLVTATEAGTPAAGGRTAQNACAPSLGFRKSAPTNMQVTRWIEPKAASPIDKLSITTLDVSAPGAVTTASGLPSVQVISDRDAPAWGPNPEVYWLPSDKSELRPLTCVPGAGSRLVCDAPDKADLSAARPQLTLQIVDQGHPGGPIKGLVSTVACGGSGPSCRQPLLWKTNPPKFVPTTDTVPSTGMPDFTHSSWTLTLQVVNVDATDKATLQVPALLPAPKQTSLPNGAIDCPLPVGRPCTATFSIHRTDLNVLTDLMEFNITKASGETFQPYQITTILTNVRPWLSQVADDFTFFYGENLVYDAIKINATEVATPGLQCVPDGTYCAVVKPFDPKLTAGLMYFVSHKPDVRFPFVKVNTTSANAPVIYAPPKKAADAQAAPASPPKTLTPQDSTALQLFMKKQEFSVQGFK
jgi:hypothetical protein